MFDDSESGGNCPIRHLRTTAAAYHEPRSMKDSQVFGCDGPAMFEVGGQFACVQLAIPEQLDHAPPRGMCERSKDAFCADWPTHARVLPSLGIARMCQQMRVREMYL